MGNKYEIKEYRVIKPGNLDIFEFEKLLKSKGVHLIEINEKKDLIKYDNKNTKDRVLQIKVRENIFEKKKDTKLQSIEKELKKKKLKVKNHLKIKKLCKAKKQFKIKKKMTI